MTEKGDTNQGCCIILIEGCLTQILDINSVEQSLLNFQLICFEFWKHLEPGMGFNRF